MRRFGISVIVSVIPLLTACIYGFAGGGLPSHIKTVAILPFENQTSASTLQRELYDRMRRDLEDRLGLRDAAENRANAIVRGRIVRYEAGIPVAYSADPNRATSADRKLQITVDVEIIDQTTGRTLWSQKGMTAEGTYSETAEASGRREAVEKIVNNIVTGAQSQW